MKAGLGVTTALPDPHPGKRKLKEKRMSYQNAYQKKNHGTTTPKVVKITKREEEFSPFQLREGS